MKRIFTILLVIGIYNIADAQIQRRFWGLELHGYYGTIEIAKSEIAKRCASLSMRADNEILAYGGVFGGFDWDLTSFEFYVNKNNESYDFMQVTFLSVHKDYNLAELRYNALSRMLKNKYGTPVSESSNSDDASFYWIDLENYICGLRISKSFDYNTNQEWAVSLIYTCGELNELHQKQKEEEL